MTLGYIPTMIQHVYMSCRIERERGRDWTIEYYAIYMLIIAKY